MKPSTTKALFFCLSSLVHINAHSDVEFNTDLLDAKNKDLVESGVFQSSGFIAPGRYSMKVAVNGVQLGERAVTFYDAQDNSSRLCLTAALADEFNLNDTSLTRLLASPLHTLDSDDVCYDPDVLAGVRIQAEINRDVVSIDIPRMYLNYSAANWDHPSRWDEGINGALLDYNLNLQERRTSSGLNNSYISGYGVAGINTGAWRWRADWQGRYQRQNGAATAQQQEWNVQRVYAYRPLPALASKLTLGEQQLGSALFDGFSFTGAALQSDDSMLPPNLRGYAPEVVGIAKSNANVVISQAGIVLYETQVPAGPFRIQDLDAAIVGVLDVRVEEQDGSVQRFQVSTANIPYLSRPGSIRYRVEAGKASSQPRDMDGPEFASGEFSWGVSNGWSLLGGALLSADYQALSLGTGRDLLQFGALSFDATLARAQLDSDVKRGGSYRINYSKRFEQYDSQIVFAGYRFSDRDFMTMNDFLSSQQMGGTYDGGMKEGYTITASKQFQPLALTAYVNYNHQSYWGRPDSDRLSLSTSRSFNLWGQHGVSVSLNLSRTEQGAVSDTTMFLSLSTALGQSRHINYSTSINQGKTSHNIGFSDRLSDRSHYSLNASRDSAYESISGFYNYTGDKASMSANLSHQPGQSTSVGASLNSGLTLTREGVAIHRVSSLGGTRVMVDTNGASGVPVHSGGPVTLTNGHGVAVLTGLSSYHRQRTSIDVTQLSDEVESMGSPIAVGTLTEGAIGYRHFDMLVGSKRMVVLQHPDGALLPFAAEVFNEKKNRLGMVGDDGMAYLSGLQANSKVVVRLGNEQQCQATLPSPLPAPEITTTLVCH